MSPAEFAIRRPVTTIMLFVSMMAVGLVASRLLPLEYFPELDVPFLGINIPYAGSAPGEVEREIARPVEEVLATISGIKRLESNSSPDGAFVSMEFDWGVDIAVKAVEARERVEAIRDQLPADIRRINVFKFNTADEAILTIRISSQRDLSNSYDMITRKLVRPLERLPGVARVQLEGLEPKEIRIELIADRVIAHGVDLNDLQRRLQAMNFSASAGMIDHGTQRIRVSPKGEFRNVGEIAEQIIGPNGLRLRDIANVTYESARRDYARHLDRKYAIGISVFKENGANLVEVGNRVLAEVNRIGNSREMQGINLFFLENQAEGVTSSLRELLKAGLLGAVLSLFVLYFFLRNMTTTLMVALAVPVAITITLGVMYFIGISLNILSMMGLMLAVGMLVDNAVVVSESIFTEREKAPGNTVPATLRGVRSVALAVAAGTLTSAAVFLPIIFGKKDQIEVFLTHVAAAIVVSLTVSLFIAQTIIPLISSRIQPPNRDKKSKLIEAIRHRYARMLKWTVRRRWLSALMILGFLLSIAVPMVVVETDMFPESQTRELFLRYNLDSRYPLERIRREAVDPIEEYLYSNQEAFEIRAVYTYYDEQGTAQSSILLTDDSEAKQSSTAISQAILEGIPKIAIGSPAFERRRSGSDGVSLTLTGRSSEQLVRTGQEVARVLNTLEGIDGAKTSQRAGDQEVQIRVDRERANQYGFSSQEVAGVVAVAMRGVDLQEFKGEEGEVPIRLIFQDADKASKRSLADLKLRNASGQQIPLLAMVDLIEDRGPVTIERINRETGLRITANLHDLTMEKAREKIRETMELMSFPPGVSWSFGQGFNDEEEAMQQMIFNILLAIAIIYIVLAAQFESLLYPASMICSILFSIVGVYWFFLFTGTTFSIMSMIGILILIGVVVNNGIVLIDHINHLRADGMARDDAVIQAGRDRLRPILMTVGTTVLGLLPLCIGTTQIGGDGPPYFPMARAIVGGLLFSTVISLLFLPSIYIWLDGLSQFSKRAVRWLFGKLGGLLWWRKRASGAKTV